jgi:hypothetical protein
VPAENVTVYESLDVTGGSLDGGSKYFRLCKRWLRAATGFPL